MGEHYNASTFISKPNDFELNTILYTQVEPNNHIEKEMDVQLRRGTCQATWRVVLDVCTAHYKKEALYGRDISTNHVA